MFEELSDTTVSNISIMVVALGHVHVVFLL